MEKNSITNRFDWAVSIIDPAPDDQILEIGPGSGLLAALICARLSSGHLTAIDSSPAMIGKAARKNQDAIRRGKLSLHLSAFSACPVSGPFNKIVAFNVNIFRHPGIKESDLLRSLILPQGLFFIFYQTPSGIDRNLLKQIKLNLTSNGFRLLDSRIEEKEPVRSFCLIVTSV